MPPFTLVDSTLFGLSIGMTRPRFSVAGAFIGALPGSGAVDSSSHGR